MLSLLMENNRRRSLSLGLSSLSVAVATMMLVACQPQEQQQRAAVDTTAITSALDSIRTAYEDAYNNGNLEAAASIVHPEMIYSPPGRSPMRGRDSIMAFEQEMRPPGATVDLEPIDTRVLSGEWVYEFGIGTITFTPEDAEEPESMESTYLAIFRKTPDGWKTYRESISANDSPPGAN